MNPILSELLRTKAHIGKSQWNREIAEYLVGFRNDQNIDSRSKKGRSSLYAIFDLEKTSIAIANVLSFFKNLHCNAFAHRSPHILLVTKLPESTFQISKPILSVVQDKWIGGMLTNWKQISESILIYSQFRTKYGSFLEKHNIHFPVYQKYQKRFQGIVVPAKIPGENSSFRLPDVLIVTHPKEYEIAILEANHLKIPVIAFVDTDVDPKILSKIDYIIPGNIKSPEFLLFCLNLFFTNILSGEEREAQLRIL